MNPRLVAISGPIKGAVFRITETALTVGRAADNNVCLDDELVSKHHFTVRLEGGRPHLRDGDTRNGTWVNGRAEFDKSLTQGDRIKCGSTTFLFLLLDDSATTLPVVIDDEIDRNRQLDTLRVDYSVRSEAAVYYRDVIRGLIKMPAFVNSISDIHELQVRLLEVAFDIIPAQRAAILLHSEHGIADPQNFSSQLYRERDFDGEARFPLSGRVLEEVYATRAASMTNNVTPVLCVPLLVSGAIRGILYMESTTFRNAFEPEHREYLQVIAENLISGLRIARQFESLRNERDVLKTERQTNDTMIGESCSMKVVRAAIQIAAQSDASVLIIGETGTGKELVARRIHELSKRASHLFVAVNCPAVVDSLFESEFFGHVKGAYTGATDARHGKFEQADGGSLLLDEIGELNLVLQPKLLRALQEREIEPVGGSRKVKFDVRIIAATNVDLEKAAQNRKFRPDLMYRLNTIRIDLPPLRERRDDIPMLADYFVGKYGNAWGVTAIAPEALEAMMAYQWPGNIRELENLIRSGVDVARAAGADCVRLQDLRGRLSKPAETGPVTLTRHVDQVAKQTRRATARQIMNETGNDAAEAARRLDISLSYLYRLLREDQNDNTD